MANGEISGVVSSAPPLAMSLRVNLSLMMFLEYAVWGAWYSVLSNRLTAMGLSDYIGRIFGTLALGSIFAPLIVGQIADRYFSSEKLLALLHLGGAGLLYWLASIPPLANRDPLAVAAAASKFYWIALAYALLYSPTWALTNSIVFTHVPDGVRDFPRVRVLGTIGWIVAGMTVGFVLPMAFGDSKLSNGPLLLAAVLSVLLGLYSFFLPHTPPKGQAGDLVPFLRALRLLKEPSFAVFFGVSFIITIVLAFYFNYTGLYLEKQIKVNDVASIMTIGQWSEMLLLPLLPWFLHRFGMKWVLAMGMLAWGVRYAIFAWGGAEAAGAFYWPVILCLVLHGVCFDFFFAAGFIHVDNESPADIKGSAQALFVFLTYGLAMWLSSELSNAIFAWTTRMQDVAVEHKAIVVKDWTLARGWIEYQVTNATAGKEPVTDWFRFWTIPSVGVLIAFVLFLLFFHMRPRRQAVTPKEDWKPSDTDAGV